MGGRENGKWREGRKESGKGKGWEGGNKGGRVGKAKAEGANKM